MNSKFQDNLARASEFAKSRTFYFITGVMTVLVIGATLPANTMERLGELSNEFKCNTFLGGTYKDRICDLRIK